MATAITALGLLLDGIGAWVLVVGTIRSRGAAIRAVSKTEATSRMPFFRRITVRATQRWASPDVQLANPDMVGDYMAMVWGAALLLLGFVGQFIGAVIGECR